MNRRKSKHKEKLNIAMFGQKRIPSREGGVEIVVEELCTRMVAQGHNVTCYNRGGHHVKMNWIRYIYQPNGIAANYPLQGFLYNLCKNPEFFDDRGLSGIHISRLDAWYKTLRNGAPTYNTCC